MSKAARPSGQGRDPVSLLWLRRDLRLEDHPALFEAAARGSVVPVFIWAPEEEGESAPGAASRWWLHHSLSSLDRALRARGSRLILRRGPAATALSRLARETGARRAAWSRVWEPALERQQDGVRAALEADGVECVEHPANLLFEPPAVRSGEGRPYRVFTPFWNRCGQLEPPGPPLSAPRKIPAPGVWPDSLALDELGLLPGHPWHEKLGAYFTPGEVDARQALSRFLEEGLADYATRRDVPAQEGTSRLSAALHFGEVSVRTLWNAASGSRQDPGRKGGFLSELGWRDFAAHVLHHFPRTVGAPLDDRFASFPWRRDAAGLAAWRQGRTGYPIVDAGMRQLWETGWMHNRVRMIVASFLTKDLLIDWREGARWFWDTLVDADLANNTLGWQWAAGCGADAAPFFRIFNPRQQQLRWDAGGAYVERWAPGAESVAPILDHAFARERALSVYRGPRSLTRGKENAALVAARSRGRAS